MLPYLEIAAVCGGLVASCLLVAWISGAIRYIPNHRAGVVEKLFSSRGSVRSGFIAREGEAGYQPQVLRGGWHVFPPFQYRVHIVSLVSISQGRVGYLFARDGRALAPQQALASNARTADFEDVEAFLRDGGERGPQRRLLREGTFAINLAQFTVLTEDRLYYLAMERGDAERFREMATNIQARQGFRPVVIEGATDEIGIVTVHDGPGLDSGEIIAPSVAGHDSFQDPEAFLLAGGHRGRQLQVLTEGTWYLNRLFATVERIPKTTVDVGFAGVVVSYTGESGDDLSGDTYSHGELVERGRRGVWSEPLLPGKYAFNRYAGKIIPVPTTNVILKWIRNQVGSHGYDQNLQEVSLITKDAFEPSLPLSVVVHIDYRKAPLVVQRFGDIQRLVEQTLDPMVAAYFKNVGQTRTLIQLLQDRSAIQDHASNEMREKFDRYNLELEEVLIGTPSGGAQIEHILEQLRARQVAEEQIETYQRQEAAAVHERSLREAESRAQQQPGLTESEIAIVVQSNEGKADYQRSVQEAGRIRVLAEAEAEKAARVGVAQAMATEEQVRAFGGPQFQIASLAIERLAKAIETAGIDMVPKIVVGGSGQQGPGQMMEGLLAVLLSEKMGVKLEEPAQRSPEAVAMRDSITRSLSRPAEAK